jgi:hypothetical protein
LPLEVAVTTTSSLPNTGRITMLKTLSLTLLVTSLALGATAAESLAKSSKNKPQPQGFQVFDAKTGDEIFNDGKQDGKACAVGQEVKFDPNTGKFKKVPSVKCNF